MLSVVVDIGRLEANEAIRRLMQKPIAIKKEQVVDGITALKRSQEVSG
jgi:hypothetical protein